MVTGLLALEVVFFFLFISCFSKLFLAKTRVLLQYYILGKMYARIFPVLSSLMRIYYLLRIFREFRILERKICLHS